MGANDRPLVTSLNEYFYSVCVNTVLSLRNVQRIGYQ